jgi:hypothetical protein
LYGNLLVQPADPDYWSPVDRELVLTVDDLLVEDGQTAPFNPTETSYAAMGRFGNVCLVSGEPDPVLEVRAGEVVRLWLTNTASTRVFNLRVPGARMKLVGGGSGLGTAGRPRSASPDRPGCWCSASPAMGSRISGSTAASLWPTPAGGRRSAWSSTGSLRPSSSC